jgi:DNA replicative helicase MCM subunit Mcm2 (Cdc46/Mcm family)
VSEVLGYRFRFYSGEFKHYFSNGIFTHPSKCKAATNCPSKIFDHRKESLEVCLVQRVKVKDNNCEGSKAVELEVELRDHLVNRVISGETVSISGVLMSLDEISDRGRQAIFTPVLLANSISRI